MTVLLFDIDGVILKPPHQLFSIQVAEKYGLSEEVLNRFFMGIFHQCLKGEVNIRDALAPELPMWGYPGTVDDFLAEWFEVDFVPNHEVLAVVDRLKEQGYPIHLATNQEIHRAGYLWERLQDHFDGIFASAHLGAKKPDPEYFQKVGEKLGEGDIYFWDDQVKNVEAAKEAGWKAFVFTTPEAILEVLEPEIQQP
ncbi:HAD-IA family hydrolase [Deinococcus cellulosilyticus]|uniref:Uncharacterized protein n=1 Tax=Deinococcus cellulosilyticus (strain DSM 18568 / NBRC 106333 / KACC 11606 / 5516J-15) TaxID=1223518 RepID=A0A511N972_DEIC1|nr:HAD-IA family hydrolase [Deinococcus cellulosilyticus]GEM49036.1 hypothetical protein DC3_46710 [Deinococcus cellulosilyticus NBRC 106333 = KACC 11606]